MADTVYLSQTRLQAPVANLAALKAINTTSVNDNVLIEVKSLGLYRFDATSVAAGDDNYIVQPTTGNGRWLKMTIAALTSTSMAVQDSSAVNISGGAVNNISIATNQLIEINGSSVAELRMFIQNLNTASANANAALYLLTGGTGGGDPFVLFSNGEGAAYHLGIDQSDSAKGKLSNLNGFGAGDLLTWDQSGNFVLTGTLSLSTALTIANGGTGATTYLAALRNLMGTTINSQSGTTYTAASATDAYRKTLFTNASGCTVTINDSSFGVGDEAYYQRGTGAGTITFAAGAGVTIYSSPTSSLKIADPALTGGAWLFKSATNTYYLRGDLTP